MGVNGNCELVPSQPIAILRRQSSQGWVLTETANWLQVSQLTFFVDRAKNDGRRRKLRIGCKSANSHSASTELTRLGVDGNCKLVASQPICILRRQSSQGWVLMETANRLQVSQLTFCVDRAKNDGCRRKLRIGCKSVNLHSASTELTRLGVDGNCELVASQPIDILRRQS